MNRRSLNPTQRESTIDRSISRGWQSSEQEIAVLHVDTDGGTEAATALEDENANLTVEAVGDETDALQTLEEQRVDCIVSDHDPPELNGVEFLRTVRDDYPDCPFVLWTDNGDESVASAAISAGVTDYLPKNEGGDGYASLATRIEQAVEEYRADQAFDEEYRWLAASVEASPLPIVAIDREGEVELWNSAAEEMFGWSAEDVLGDKMPIVPQGKQSEFRLLRERVLDGETFTDVRIQREAKSGDPLDLVLSTAPIRDASGEITGVMAVFKRASKRERVLEEWHEASREFMQAESKEEVGRAAVEKAGELLDLPLGGCWLYDEDDDVLEPIAATEEAESVFGELPTYTGEGSLSWDAFETGTVETYDDIVAESDPYDPDSPVRSEIVVPIGDYGVLNVGSTEPASFERVDVSLMKVLAANVEATFERAERERKLERQNDRLETFASVVAHDLRNPLHVISGSIQIAEESGDPEHFRRCQRAVERMETLIDDLLVLAREGEAVSDTDVVELSESVDRCWRIVETADATLHNEAETAMRADESRLRQLLSNLFRNAVEHGGEDVTITVGTIDDGFYVEDDGVGIPDDRRERVFEHGFSTAESGTGLGLSIVDRIASAHGWDVSIADGESGGARFEITGVTFEG